MLELPTMPPFGTSIKGDYIKILAKIHRNNPLAEFLFDVSVQVDPVNMQVNRIFFGNTPATSHASMNVETEGLYSFAKFSNVFNARTAPDERRYQAIRNALKTYIFKVVQFMINSQANTGKTSTSSSQFIPNIVEKVTNFLLELEKVIEMVDNVKYSLLEAIQKAQWMDPVTKAGAKTKLNSISPYVSVWETLKDPDKLQQFYGNVDGVHTAIENVADIVGFEVGYKAYQRHIQRHDPEKDLNAFLDFSHDKWFTLAFANMHCIHASLEYIYGQITEDENPPHSVRVNVTYGLETVKHHLEMLDLPEIPPFHKEPPASYEVINVLARVHRYSPSTSFLFNIDILNDLRDIKQNYITFEPTPSSINAYVKDDNKPRNKFELTTAEIRQALVNNITKTVNFMYESMKIRLTDDESKKKNVLIQDVSKFLIELEKSITFFGPSYLQEAKNEYDRTITGTTTLPRALNYGSLGVTIGHKLGHAFDKKGMGYTLNGKYEPSLSDQLIKEYEKREKCFEDSFGKYYHPLVEKWVDGHATLEENMADSLGFEVALRAYQKLVGNIGIEPYLEYLGFTHEELFTLAYANIWCENSSPRRLSKLMEMNDHTVNPIRVNGVMKNSEEFARIWKCKKNTPMNPPLKCKIFS
ncbi:hypothetical protein V9T40_002598 [Parthenolecanium corni]|uniref:Peptidase M13 C-terminal domain-containing protein n=1 Tax=Parthenolecanium corni TaxID=536013 RepID=A0AAN9Y5I2_9HEMI